MSKVNIAVKTTRGGVSVDENGEPIVVSRVLRSRTLRGREVQVISYDNKTFQVHRSRGRGLPFIYSNRPTKPELLETA